MALSADQSRAKIPTPALILGIAGLIPFIAPPLWIWTMGPTAFGALEAIRMERGYGAIILAFMGAIHWGLEMAERGPGLRWSVLSTAVSPALLAFLALQFPSSQFSFFILATGFVILLGYDIARKSECPSYGGWYLRLRVPLTIVAVASLIATALA